MTTQRTKTEEKKAASPSIFDTVAQVPDDLDDDDKHVPRAAIQRVEAASGVTAIPAAFGQMALLDPKKIEDALRAREKAIAIMGEVAIKGTNAYDWTAFKDREGRIVCVLRDSGAVKIRKWLQIRIFGHRPHPEAVNGGASHAEPRMTRVDEDVTDKDGHRTGEKREVYVAEMWADGICELTGEMVEGVHIALRSTDSFTGRGTLEDLKVSCRTGLDTKIVRILSSLRKVPLDTLKATGIDEAKIYKGSGFGTSTERNAGRVAETGEEFTKKKEAFRADILRRVGGDADAARDLLKDITSYKYGPNKDKTGWRKSVDEFTEGWQIDKAMEKLAAHPTFGDKARRNPGEDDE